MYLHIFEGGYNGQGTWQGGWKLLVREREGMDISKKGFIRRIIKAGRGE
jgi:hypothetical protein